MTDIVTIRGIAAGGEGVGTLPDGLTVFVPRVAPGETVSLAPAVRRRRYARARVDRVLEPAPERVAPRCPHYTADECGGCQLQHLDSAAQRRARRAIVEDALRRIGGLDVLVPEIEPADTEWEYRTRITLAVKGRVIGFHRLNAPGSVFDLERCHIARPEIQRLWSAVREHRRLLPADAESLVLRVDRAGARHLIVRARGDRAWTAAAELGSRLERAGEPAVLWWEPEHGAPRVVHGGGEAFPATVFEQVHPEMGDRVRAHAVAELGAVTGRTVWDLYAGVGETSAALAALGARVESVELDRRAVAQAERTGPAGVRRHGGRVEDVLDRLGPAELVVLNPPRTGVAPAVTARLAAGDAERLVYISCDPATLARDATRLAPGWRFGAVRAFDLFPQTAHVETVARFERP